MFSKNEWIVLLSISLSLFPSTASSSAVLQDFLYDQDKSHLASEPILGDSWHHNWYNDLNGNGKYDPGEPWSDTEYLGWTYAEDNSCWMATASNIVQYMGGGDSYYDWAYNCIYSGLLSRKTFENGSDAEELVESLGYTTRSIGGSLTYWFGWNGINPADWMVTEIQQGSPLRVSIGIPLSSLDGTHSITVYGIDTINETIFLADSDNDVHGDFRTCNYVWDGEQFRINLLAHPANETEKWPYVYNVMSVDTTGQSSNWWGSGTGGDSSTEGDTTRWMIPENWSIGRSPIINDDVYISFTGHGQVDIDCHAKVNVLALSSGANVNVSSENSLIVDDLLRVGMMGFENTLNITSGGIVSGKDGHIHNNSVVKVTGSDSSWTNSRDLYIGYGGGGGELEITDGGLVTVNSILTIDCSGGNNSFINMDSGGRLALYDINWSSGDNLNDFLTLINGTSAINYRNQSGWSNINGAVYGLNYTLEHITDGGDLDSYTVLTVIAPNLLQVTPTSGPNGLIDPSTSFAVEYGENVSFTATHNSGYMVDRWYVNGSEYASSVTSISPTIIEDTTVLVTFKPDGSTPSQITVVGSTSPDPFDISMEPNSSASRFYYIPVYNTGHNSVVVNCSKNGTAANWTTLESSSFTLAGYQTKKFKVSFSVPDGTASGLYYVNLVFNDVTFRVNIRVAVTGETFMELLSPSTGQINGNGSAVSYSFDNYSYDSFNISGRFHVHAQTYRTLSDSEYLNARNFRLAINLENISATNQNLIVYLNGVELDDDITSSFLPIGQSSTYHVKDLPWEILRSGVNVILFGLRLFNSNDETVLWRVNDNMWIATTSTISTYSANQAVVLPTNVWNAVDDGYLDNGAMEVYISSVASAGRIELYNNGKYCGYTSVSSSDVGKTKKIYVGRSDLDEENLFVIKGNPDYPGIVNISNPKLSLCFYSEDPVLEVSKQLSSNRLQVGQQATVTVHIENIGSSE